jgi:tetratricopeptide (TPR) repeat protein
VAETLEKTFGSDAPDHLPELAHHWLNAVPPAVAGADRRKAVDYAQRAARRAMGALAYEQAAGHCEAALDVLTADDAVLRGELLTELGEARWRSGDITGAREAFGQAAVVARGLDDGELLARAALGYGVGLGGAGTAVQADPTLLSLLDEALCAIGEADQPLRVRLLGRLAVELYWTDETDRREAVGREAVAAAQRLGDPAVEIVALYSRHWSMLGPDGIGERQAATDDLVRIAEAIGDGEMAFRGHYMRLRTALEMGDITAADNALERCSALAGELRQPFYAWQTLVFRATNAISEGHVAEGGILAREAFETGQRVAPQAATSVFGAHMAMYHLLKGTVDEMLPRIRDRVANLPDEPIWRGFLVWSCAEAGHLEEARVNFQAMAAKGFGCMRRNGNWIATVHFLGRACGLLDAADAAAFLYGLLLPYQGRSAIGSNGGYRDSSVDGSLGSLAAAMGRLDDAARHFEEALRRDAASRSRGFMVVTSRDYARMLLRRRAPGDLERAGEVIAQALLTARNAGMSTLARQLIELQA